MSAPDFSPEAIAEHGHTTTPIVVYCDRCDYFLKVVVFGAIGTHGCAQCDGLMEVYVPQEMAVRDYEHHRA